MSSADGPQRLSHDPAPACYSRRRMCTECTAVGAWRPNPTRNRAPSVSPNDPTYCRSIAWRPTAGWHPPCETRSEVRSELAARMENDMHIEHPRTRFGTHSLPAALTLVMAMAMATGAGRLLLRRSRDGGGPRGGADRVLPDRSLLGGGRRTDQSGGHQDLDVDAVDRPRDSPDRQVRLREHGARLSSVSMAARAEGLQASMELAPIRGVSMPAPMTLSGRATTPVACLHIRT